MGEKRKRMIFTVAFVLFTFCGKVSSEQYLVHKFYLGDVLWQPGASVSAVSHADDTPLELASLEFSFPYFSKSFRGLYISANGVISFEGKPPCGCCYAEPQSSGCWIHNSYHNTIFVQAHDLNPAPFTSATVSYTSTQDVFTVTWLNVPPYSASSPTATFRASLFPTGTVMMEYRDFSPTIDLVGLRPGEVRSLLEQDILIDLAGEVPGSSPGLINPSVFYDGGWGGVASATGWGPGLWGVYPEERAMEEGSGLLFCPMPTELCVEPAGAYVGSNVTLVTVSGHHFGCLNSAPAASDSNGSDPAPPPELSLHCHFSHQAPPRDLGADAVFSGQYPSTPSFRHAPLPLPSSNVYGEGTPAVAVVGDGGAVVQVLCEAPPEMEPATVHFFLSYSFGGGAGGDGEPTQRFVLQTAPETFSYTQQPQPQPQPQDDGGDDAAAQDEGGGEGEGASSTCLGVGVPGGVVPGAAERCVLSAEQRRGSGWLYDTTDCAGVCGGRSVTDATGACCLQTDMDCSGSCSGSSVVAPGYQLYPSSMGNYWFYLEDVFPLDACCRSEAVDCNGVCGSAVVTTQLLSYRDSCGECAGILTGVSAEEAQDCEGGCTGAGEDCGAAIQDVDCVMSAWTAWSACEAAAQCETGSMFATRYIQQYSSGAGTACSPYMHATSTCFLDPDDTCERDCVLGPWQSWGGCSSQCGAGTQMSSRSTVSNPANGGVVCGTRFRERPCNNEPDFVPPSWCAASEGGGGAQNDDPPSHDQAPSEDDDVLTGGGGGGYTLGDDDYYYYPVGGDRPGEGDVWVGVVLGALAGLFTLFGLVMTVQFHRMRRVLRLREQRALEVLARRAAEGEDLSRPGLRAEEVESIPAFSYAEMPRYLSALTAANAGPLHSVEVGAAGGGVVLLQKAVEAQGGDGMAESKHGGEHGGDNQGFSSPFSFLRPRTTAIGVVDGVASTAVGAVAVMGPDSVAVVGPMSFGGAGVADEEGPTCAICLDEFNAASRVRLLRCTHVFHVECIDSWLQGSKLCPLCKQNPVRRLVPASDAEPGAAAAAPGVGARAANPAEQSGVVPEQLGFVVVSPSGGAAAAVGAQPDAEGSSAGGGALSPPLSLRSGSSSGRGGSARRLFFGGGATVVADSISEGGGEQQQQRDVALNDGRVSGDARAGAWSAPPAAAAGGAAAVRSSAATVSATPPGAHAFTERRRRHNDGGGVERHTRRMGAVGGGGDSESDEEVLGVPVSPADTTTS